MKFSLELRPSAYVSVINCRGHILHTERKVISCLSGEFQLPSLVFKMHFGGVVSWRKENKGREWCNHILISKNKWHFQTFLVPSPLHTYYFTHPLQQGEGSPYNLCAHRENKNDPGAALCHWSHTRFPHSHRLPQGLSSVSAAAGLFLAFSSPLSSLQSLHKHPPHFSNHAPSDPSPTSPPGSALPQTLCASRCLSASLVTSGQHSLLEPLLLGA